MNFIKAKWFGNLCRLMALLFFFQTALPSANGFPIPRASFRLGPSAAFAQGPEWHDPIVDADYTDRFIQEKLSELPAGVDNALSFVQNEINFEAYTGSLRGARGTLWSGAGNSLDQASLLIALLRGQGIACRYVRGSLPDNDIKILIRSMFNEEKLASAVGYIPEESHGTQWKRNDPENDPFLQARVADHWWVELYDGTRLDPCFIDGRVPGTASSTHLEVPDELRHKVTVRLKAEFYNMLSQYQYETPLAQTFTTAEVYGKPLTIAHFVSTYQPPALIGGYKTYTYSPYISISDNDEVPENDHIIQGEDYQEFFNTLIPMANSTLTRLTLEMEVIDPGEEPDLRTRDLLDRVGFAARHGMAEPAGVDTEKPALSEFDATTLYIMPGFIDWEGTAPLQDGLQALEDEVEALDPGIDDVMAKAPEDWTPEDRETIRQHTALSRMIQGQGMAIAAAMFIRDSDYYARIMRESHLIHAYYDSPRLTLCQSRLSMAEGESESTMELGLDLRRNHIRAVPYPGQNAIGGFLFNMRKGRWDSLLEHEIMDLILETSGQAARFSTSPTAVWLAAQDQGIPIVKLKGTGDIPGRLETLAISPEAKARIAQALKSGRAINVPATMVDVDGTPAIGWYEIDMKTGEIVSVSENGGRQEAIEFGLIAVLVFFGGLFATLIFGKNIVNSFIGSESAVRTSQSNTPLTISAQMPVFQPDYETSVDINRGDPPTVNDNVFGLTDETTLQINSDILYNYNEVLEATGASGSIIDYAGRDTEVITLFSPAPDDIAGTRLDGPGIGLETVTDDDFWAKTGDNQIPSAFRARISNTGTDDDFILEGNAPAGWELLISRPVNPVPAGITGEVSAFLRPLDTTPLPNPGTAVSFDLTASRSDDPNATLTQTTDFIVPEIAALLMDLSPGTLYMAPGDTADTRVTLTNTGNVAQTVSLNMGLPEHFTAGDPGPAVELAPGETLTRTLSLTAGAVDLDTGHTAWLTAGYGDSEKRQALNLYVAAPGSVQALEASDAAENLGNDDLAAALQTLGQDLSSLYQDLENAAVKSRVLSTLESLAGQMDDPLLAALAAQIESSRDAVAAGTADTLETALDDLGTVLTSVSRRLSDMAAHDFEMALDPNRAEALPDTPVDFGIYIKNTGNETTTYTLTLSPLPAGITGSLSQASVTLAPGWSVDPGTTGTHILPLDLFVTLTQPVDELTAFEFTVTAQAQGCAGHHPNGPRQFYGKNGNGGGGGGHPGTGLCRSG